MPDFEGSFTKENLDACLMALAKEYRRIAGRGMPAEIVLVGGAAVLTGYGFRAMTSDVDALIRAASTIKEAINTVGDQLGLPNGWINADFQRTASFSPKLAEHSKYYKTFCGVLEVRTIEAEYLIAMKLRSGRQFKNDLSDVIGILAEHEKRGNPITMNALDRAVQNLYGGWDGFPPHAHGFIESALQRGNYEELYAQARETESRATEALLAFEKANPGLTREDNVDEIIQSLSGMDIG